MNPPIDTFLLRWPDPITYSEGKGFFFPKNHLRFVYVLFVPSLSHLFPRQIHCDIFGGIFGPPEHEARRYPGLNCYDLLMTSHYTGVLFFVVILSFYLCMGEKEEETFAKLIYFGMQRFSGVILLGAFCFGLEMCFWVSGLFMYVARLCVIVYWHVSLLLLEGNGQSSAAIKD